MAEYWKARWHRLAVALKFKEEELQRLQRQSGTWPPQGRLQQRPQASPRSLQMKGAVGAQVCQGAGVCSVDSTRGQWVSSRADWGGAGTAPSRGESWCGAALVALPEIRLDGGGTSQAENLALVSHCHVDWALWDHTGPLFPGAGGAETGAM
ncbi:uncharacterized protein LOC107968378 [Pan troglodytes]|uniref:uncharacterized protein LOC107968378 n=1 Tax=Pan troglodytes TaxID=9598 RepID=UPI0023F07EAB|nr:uncharacterized protein LOC107968378 [Pan troglodytes]